MTPRVKWGSALNGGGERHGVVCGYAAHANRTYAIVISDGYFYEVPVGDLRHTGWER